MHRWLFPVLAALALAGSTGCRLWTSSPEPAGAFESIDPDEDVRWPYWPTRMRIHPLTRLSTAERGDLIIEARIEFFDGDDDTTKGVGQIQIELHPATNSNTATRPITSWEHDLRDLAANRRHFDQVTLTYLFRLEVQPSKLDRPVELRAFFLSATGQMLPAAKALRLRSPAAPPDAVEPDAVEPGASDGPPGLDAGFGLRPARSSSTDRG